MHYPKSQHHIADDILLRTCKKQKFYNILKMYIKEFNFIDNIFFFQFNFESSLKP